MTDIVERFREHRAREVRMYGEASSYAIDLRDAIAEIERLRGPANDAERETVTGIVERLAKWCTMRAQQLTEYANAWYTSPRSKELQEEEAKMYSDCAAALRAPRVPSGWRPIETADKANGSILVYCAEYKNTYSAIWWQDNWHHFGDRGGRMRETPTHWMPRPEAPASPAPPATPEKPA